MTTTFKIPEGINVTEKEKAQTLNTLTLRMQHMGHQAVAVPAVITLEGHAMMGYLATAGYGSTADFCSGCGEPVRFL